MTPEGNRIFGYGRASTKRQVDSPDTQKGLIENYASLMSLGQVDAFFIDPATSGKINMDQRIAGKDMLSRLRPGDHVIVSKLDRGFRKLADACLIMEHFQRTGVKLHVCNLMGGAIDLSSPMGRFILQVLAAFAELERAFISDRIREGMAHLARKGQKFNDRAPYGFKWEYRKIDGKKVGIKVPDDEERNIMREIMVWRNQEYPLSWTEILDILTKERKAMTKEGKLWSVHRCQRAFRAELQLQSTEFRSGKP